jgi:hypothetical protein
MGKRLLSCTWPGKLSRATSSTAVRSNSRPGAQDDRKLASRTRTIARLMGCSPGMERSAQMWSLRRLAARRED